MCIAHEYVVHVCCGSHHCLALTTTGSLFAWGANHYGQCGVELNQSKLIKPTVITTLECSPMLYITVGGYHSMALSYTGKIYVWGKNEFGQLGLGHNQPQRGVTTLSFLEDQKISYIDCGEDFSTAVTEDGGLFTWGAGMYGQLGHGDKKNDLLPKQVTELMGHHVVQVTCGRCHMLILDSNSKVYSTGLNGCGQLGLGNRENKLVPTLINTKNLLVREDTMEVDHKDGHDKEEKGAKSYLSKNTHIYQISTSRGDHSFFITNEHESSFKDYRKLDKQILELDNSMFEKFVNLNPNSSVPMDYLDYIEKGLSSIPSWNASYVVKNAKLPAIDWIEAKKGFKCIKSINNARIRELIYANIANNVIKKLPLLENVRKSPEVLRIYLLLPLLHFFEQEVNIRSSPQVLILDFSHRFFEMTMLDDARKPLEAWLGEVTNEFILRRFLKLYKKSIVDILSEQKRIHFNQQQSQGISSQGNEHVYMFDSMDAENELNIDNPAEAAARRLRRSSSRVIVDSHLQQSLTVFLECLQFVYRISQKNKLISYKEFYIPEIINLVDIKYDYIYWVSKSQRTHKLSDVYLCSYPFIFNTKCKSLILETDSAIQQKNAAENALYRCILAGPIAVLTEDPHLVITVSRRNLIRDTIDQFLCSGRSLNFKKPLKVKFEGEDAIDAGSGMKKEFFLLLLKEILDPKYGMFIEYKDANVIWFNPLESEDLIMYELIGIICGLAIYNQAIINLPFPLVLYKKIIMEDFGLDDLASLDSILEKNLREMLNPDLSEEDFNAAYDTLNFTLSLECYGAPITFPLVQGGESKSVTYENRHEYVQAYWKFILNDCINTQFQFFVKGFTRVVDREILGFFHAEELLELVTGQEVEDWKELEEGTFYKLPFHRKHPTIVRFWQVFHSLLDAEKKKFLLFLTGSDRVPIQGMRSLKVSTWRLCIYLHSY